MPDLAFTEFRLPHGEQHQITLPVSDEAFTKAQRLIDRGLSFTCEMLRTGDMVVYITDNARCTDADMMLVPANTPPNKRMPIICQFILDFDADKYAEECAAHDRDEAVVSGHEEP